MYKFYVQSGESGSVFLLLSYIFFMHYAISGTRKIKLLLYPIRSNLVTSPGLDKTLLCFIMLAAGVWNVLSSSSVNFLFLKILWSQNFSFLCVQPIFDILSRFYAVFPCFLYVTSHPSVVVESKSSLAWFWAFLLFCCGSHMEYKWLEKKN